MQLVFLLNSILHLSVIRYGSGVQTRTSTFFFELLKQQEFLHFVLLGPCITSFPSLPSSIHPFHTVLFSFSSQCYPRVDTILERTYFLALFDVLPTLLSHLPAMFSPIYLIFSHNVFIRKHFFQQHESSLSPRGPSEFPGNTAAEKTDKTMIPVEQLLVLVVNRDPLEKASSALRFSITEWVQERQVLHQSFQILYRIRSDLSEDSLRPCKWQDITHNMKCCWRA